jgi:hypothetical protein
MGTPRADHSCATARLLEQTRAGSQAALNELFARHRARLRRMVQLRLDRRLQARFDAAAKRYLLALKRLKAILATMPGGLDNV